MNEIWKDIPFCCGYYQASNMGKIRSLDRVVEYKRKGSIVKSIKRGRVLRPHTNRYGYPMVVICAPNHKKNHSVHRLVMLAFVGDSELTVNHKNGVKTDNSLSNLEYLTMSDNLLHAHRTGLKHAIKTYKYTNADIEAMKSVITNNGFRWFLAAKELNMTPKKLQGIFKYRDKEFHDSVPIKLKKLKTKLSLCVVNDNGEKHTH